MRIQGALFALVIAYAGGVGACAADDSDSQTTTDDALSATPIQVLRGVDRASVFSTGEARTLHDHHGVRWSGVYIGGPCNGGSGWTKARVTAIANATHWQFM